MPLFQIDKSAKAELIRTKNFNLGKELQSFVESNIETIFNCRFVASEYSTGQKHAGRIDTLALSEENNPVIIEYKKVESSELITQSLYYLDWINDHQGDFQIAVEKAIGKKQTIDWDLVRIICIAPGYKKFDMHAAQAIGPNIELWQYRLYTNNVIYLEDVLRKSSPSSESAPIVTDKKAVQILAGKKAAITKATGVYTFDEHIEGVSQGTKSVVLSLRDFIMELDDMVEEVPKKLYVAYKLSKNFCCLQTAKNKVTLFLKIDPKTYKKMPENSRDVSEIGHFGTGDFEYTIHTLEEVEQAKTYIKQAFENIGG